METAELSTKNILSLFETNKEQRQAFVNDIIQRLEDGEAEPLEVHLQVKAMEDIITQLTSTDKTKNKNVDAALRYKTLLVDAFKNNCNGQKSFDFHSATFTQMEAGTKWHYENCNDSELKELYDQQAELKKKIGEKEDFLKTVPQKGLAIINEETGETVTVYPPYKTSTTSISVKHK